MGYMGYMEKIEEERIYILSIVKEKLIKELNIIKK